MKTKESNTYRDRLVLLSRNQLKWTILYLLVMFFMFHILVFTVYFCGKSSIAGRANNHNLTDYFKENAEVLGHHHNFQDDARNKNHGSSNQNLKFHIIKNLTSNHRNNNLKSNVFDQMLSDEMLSMKQRFFEKDLAYTSTVQKVPKSNVATPTLEVRQKWPVVDLFTRPQDTDDIDDDYATQTESYEINHKSKLNSYEPKIKSLDVRSLSGHSQNSIHDPEIKCNCANAKANANHQCKHGEDCTRKVPHGSAIENSAYPAFYLPYQAYFVSDNNDLKVPKATKRRKPSKFHDGDLYYEDDWKKKRRLKDDDEIIMNIDYDVEDNKMPKFPLNCIHKDLNEVYNNGVQRKCYCSSSQTTRSQSVVIISLFLCLVASDWT